MFISPSTALKSENPLMNSYWKDINWEVFLSDDSCETDRVFNRGQRTIFMFYCSSFFDRLWPKLV